VVAVTEGIVDCSTGESFAGSIAHELAHLKNRDILVSSIGSGGAAVVTYVAHALSSARCSAESSPGRRVRVRLAPRGFS